MPRPRLAADEVLGRARTSRRTRPRRSACRGSRGCRWRGPPSSRRGRRRARTCGRAPAASRRRTPRGRGAPALRSGSVRASSISASARPANVRPRLHAVDEVAAVGRRRGDLHAGDVGAVVGLGHHDADHQLAGRDARQPRAASAPRCRRRRCARVRISGRVMSEPPTPSEPHDSSSVATTMPR